jgi:hypothetical protein
MPIITHLICSMLAVSQIILGMLVVAHITGHASHRARHFGHGRRSKRGIRAPGPKSLIGAVSCARSHEHSLTRYASPGGSNLGGTKRRGVIHKTEEIASALRRTTQQSLRLCTLELELSG